MKVWVISVDMGYGHQRAAYPLKDIAFERIITANDDKMVSEREHRIWEFARNFYEFVSRLQPLPIIGKLTFGVYDKLQVISPIFPFRDLSKPNLATLHAKRSIQRGVCANLVQYVR